MISPIQYLRAIAALMVVWHHSLSQIAGVRELIPLPEFGPAGVDLFFVISGFIMVVTTAGKDLNPAQFMAHRIVRVVPLYWLVTLALIGCAVVAPSAFKSLLFTPAAIAKSLLFIPYDSLSFPGETWPVLVPGWTLNYEMFFYALFAASLWLPKEWPLRAMTGVLGGLVVVGAVSGVHGPLAGVYTSPMLLEFGAGMWIAHALLQGRVIKSLPVATACAGFGFFLLTLPGNRTALLCGAALIVGAALNPRIRAVRCGVLLELGNASYSVYLTHLFTLGALRVVSVRLISHVSLASAVAFMAVALVVSAAVGWVCYRWVETPLTAWLRGLIQPSRQSAARVTNRRLA